MPKEPDSPRRTSNSWSITWPGLILRRNSFRGRFQGRIMRALLSLVILALWVQSPPPDPTAVQDGKVYICPMDPDVRSNSPGKCARCGMALVAGLPDPVEYHMDLTVAPRPPNVGDTASL